MSKSELEKFEDFCKTCPPFSISKLWELEAHFERIQFDNWIHRCVCKHMAEGYSECESKVAVGGENILFSELAMIPDWEVEEEC